MNKYSMTLYQYKQIFPENDNSPLSGLAEQRGVAITSAVW
jgi:hypothetical protein